MIRLLVVDDDDAVRRAMRRQLEQIEDVFVEDFSSGEAALARVNQRESPPFQGALLDIEMPGLDGEQLARELVRIDATIRVAFVTGSGRVAAALGHPVIPKPWAHEQVSAFVAVVRGGGDSTVRA